MGHIRKPVALDRQPLGRRPPRFGVSVAWMVRACLGGTGHPVARHRGGTAAQKDLWDRVPLRARFCPSLASVVAGHPLPCRCRGGVHRSQCLRRAFSGALGLAVLEDIPRPPGDPRPALA